MPKKQPESTFLLQIKGDASFSLFSHVKDVESLSETWKLCSKVAGHLEQGKRLENLSWRLFHLHSTMAAQSMHNRTRAFEKISKETGKKLERERHLGLSQLQAPLLKGCHCMNQPICGVSATIHHPALLCSLSNPSSENCTGGLVNRTTITSATHISISPSYAWDLDFKTGSINFESLISSFSPLALLDAVDYFSQENFNVFGNEASKMKDLAPCDTVNHPPFDEENDERLAPHNKKIPEESRKKFELVQEAVDISQKNNLSSSSIDSVLGEPFYLNDCGNHGEPQENQFMGSILSFNDQITIQNDYFNENSQGGLQSTEINYLPTFSGENENKLQGNTEISLEAPCRLDIQTIPQIKKVGEKRKRRNPMATRLPKFVGMPTVPERSSGELSERSICFNCRGTHTPLWRRGPNDEILCNACGVFYNVHKRNRPPSRSKFNYLAKSSPNVNSDTGSQGTRIECTNCNAKATPMWRKAPDGSLLCNACALYFKCHKRSRPVNCAKPASSKTASVVSQPSDLSCSDWNTSLGIRPANFELSSNDPTFISNSKSRLIDDLDKEIGRSTYFNEPNQADFFEMYPACFYTSSNF